MSSSHQLVKEFKELQTNPSEGFDAFLVGDDIYLWEVGIFGAPETLYEGGYFKAKLKFPKDYPYAPFIMQFTTPMWHPNIYSDGTVCISILHPPGEDPLNSFERPEERWNPTQNVSNVIVSVVSMLVEPETRSPANVNASVMYRKNRSEYERRVAKLVEESRKIALRDNVKIPLTVTEYTERSQRSRQYQFLDSSIYDDNYYNFSEDDDDDDDIKDE